MDGSEKMGLETREPFRVLKPTDSIALPAVLMVTLRLSGRRAGAWLAKADVIYSLTRNKVYLNSVCSPSSQIGMKCCPP